MEVEGEVRTTLTVGVAALPAEVADELAAVELAALPAEMEGLLAAVKVEGESR